MQTAHAPPRWLVGIDIGGTFTDVAAFESQTGALRIEKVVSTPDDPSRAVTDGLERLLDSVGGLEGSNVRFFAHGTTVATNTLLELRGSTVGLLVTRGMGATYELHGGLRPTGPELVDPFYAKPPVLVPSRLTEQIDERLAFDGSVVTPLDEGNVRRAVARLRTRGVDSIAVTYLFSYMNPRHEERTAQIIQDEYPSCRVALSSRVLPAIREYQRLSTTVLDAYVGPVIQTYLEHLEGRLRGAGLTTHRLFLMQSNGGLMRIGLAATYPVQMLLSGPAAGVIFGAEMARLTGRQRVITFDVGGTSSDISVISGGAVEETRQGQIGGHEIGTPMIRIRTLGAGGGTIAWIGRDGLLKAGPRSAGAEPGPACYARGGAEPTVTDANLVLGYLAPDTFAGGKLSLDPSLAERAIRERVASVLGLTLEQAALGIIRVVNVNMEVGLRLSLIERGLDHRAFALIAFGGAGPVHAPRVARNVGIPFVLVPPHPGVSCAMGLLQTDVKHFYMRSRPGSLGSLPLAEVNSLFDALREHAHAEARLEGLDPARLEILRQLDLRYPSQGYELSVACGAAPLVAADRELIRRRFDAEHQQVYGVCAPDAMPEIVNVRVTAVSRLPKLRLPQVPAGGRSAADALAGYRRAVFEEYGEPVDTPVYRREALRAGNEIHGPAIVEQPDSTTVILPRQRAEVDNVGMLTIAVEA